jgi:hypothetical protein
VPPLVRPTEDEVDDNEYRPSHPVAERALDDRLGFIGMTGSRKTFCARSCVERILAKGDGEIAGFWSNGDMARV